MGFLAVLLEGSTVVGVDGEQIVEGRVEVDVSESLGQNGNALIDGFGLVETLVLLVDAV